MLRTFYWLLVVVVAMSLKPAAISPRDMDLRQWSAYAKAQQAFPTQDAKPFTPTWTGFTAAPTGTLSYIDGGSFAIIFNEGAAKTGTANGTVMQFSGIPASIAPMDLANGISAVIFDDGSGGVNYPGVWTYSSSTGRFSFGSLQVLSAPGTVVRQFTVPAGVAGLPASWYIMYPTATQ